jgi:hypothetical protein
LAIFLLKRKIDVSCYIRWKAAAELRTVRRAQATEFGQVRTFGVEAKIVDNDRMGSLMCRTALGERAMAGEQSDFELELYRRVDEILYYVWDPIGLAASPAARNEYKGYLPEILTMLQMGLNAPEIASYLDKLATENMGLSADPEYSKRVAELLLDWKSEIYRNRRQQP